MGVKVVASDRYSIMTSSLAAGCTASRASRTPVSLKVLNICPSEWKRFWNSPGLALAMRARGTTIAARHKA